MPTYRADLESIPTYSPGKPIDEVSRELGIDDIAKLASNESPTPPFPEVQAVIAAAAVGVNRYPENSGFHLVNALAERLAVEPGNIWLGAGSTELLMCAALAAGGPDTSAVFADPSFVMYPIATVVSGAKPVPVALDGTWRLDLDAMAAAITGDTTIVYVCNPNNPTATYRSAEDVASLIASVPDEVLVIVDEAYHEYVTAPDYASALPFAVERDNVIVARTFSKVYGLAGLRVGYAVGTPGTLGALRRTQIPFSVSVVASAAAIEALRHDDLTAERVKENATGRELIEEGLAAMGLDVPASQTNFVMAPVRNAEAIAEATMQRGVIVRPMGSLLRMSVGTSEENHRLLAVLDEVGIAE